MRPGCAKDYTESENSETSCSYHNGKPMFHDVKKGWTCCNQVVYDWDEFTKLKGCQVGSHTDIKQENEFFKSSAVSNAQKGIDKEDTPQVKVRDIGEYEKEQKRIVEEKKKKEEEKPKEVLVSVYIYIQKSSDGKFFCGNPGCASKTYNLDQNEEGCCKHHAGQPVFHDRKKYWTCCKQEAYDWDDFMKLDPCVVGKHIPKYKN